MQNTFPRFNTSFGSYPLPLSNAQMGTTTFPTNSWFEHAFNPLIPDQNRYGQAIPWYWLPFYTQNTMNLCYTGTVPFNNHNEQGNLVLQEDPINDITVGTPSPTSLNITALDDFTATFVQTSASGSVTSYPMRGSPFATFVYNSTPVSIVFNRIQPITNFTALPGNIGYVFDTPFSSTSTFHSSMVPQTNGSFQTGELAFYNGPNNTGLNATATYSDNSKFTVTMNLPTVPTTAISVTLLLGSNIPPFLPILPLGYTMTYSNTDRNVPSITVTTNNNESLSVNGDLHQVNYPYAAYTTYTHPQNFRWFIFTNATLTVTNNTISTAGNYTGVIQIAAGGADQGQYTELQTIFAAYAGNYTTSGSTNTFVTGPPTTFNITWNFVGSPLLWLAPNHWSLMTLTGIAPLAGTTPVFPHYIYGNLGWYTINTSPSTVSIIDTIIPTGPNISSLTAAQKTLLTNQVMTDLGFLPPFVPGAQDPQNSSNPYSYGQAACTLGRILVFANLLGITGPNVTSATAILVNTLTDYMNGTNSNTTPAPNQNVFQLQYDFNWGGVVVPADYLTDLNKATITSYGNSYYNDHHFHYGYLLYALYTLELIGAGISGSFIDQITAIITDIVNPVVNVFSWKTRHKDWYAGHSWATGLTNFVNRQQESSGEAINGYYAAYLMATVISNTALANTAAVCMWLELLASQQYYAMRAPGSSIGIMTRVGNIGLLQTSGRAFTLDWGMQPDTYNGRAIGMYGIQTLPYTEIAPILINNHWVNILPKLNPSYALTPSLVIGLNDNVYNPVPTPNQFITSDSPFKVATDGSFWGLVGLEILAFSPGGITNPDAQTAYNNAQNKQTTNPQSPVTKQFDSFSNILYFLLLQNRFP